MTHPRPDRSDYRPNFRKTIDNDTLSIGWREGVFRNGRPYRAELWAQDQLTCLTVFFSTDGMEHLTNAAACDFLEEQGVLRYYAASGFRSSYARPFIDPSGNPMWSVNVVLASETAEFADAPGPFLPYFGSSASGSVPAKPRNNIRIGKDTTLRWSFRSDDYLVWVRVPIWASDPSPDIVDVWELRDGNHALLTNRWEDVPDWFELHPSEVCNGAAFRMMERLKAGYEPETTHGPNIWRVMAGDWLLWVGPERAGIDVFQDGFALAQCDECVLVIGESAAASVAEVVVFGAPQTGNFSEQAMNTVRAGIAEIRQRGLPWSVATEWLLG